eukprot:2338545-Alexandrium_andersonii.AAC.1
MFACSERTTRCVVRPCAQHTYLASRPRACRLHAFGLLPENLRAEIGPRTLRSACRPHPRSPKHTSSVRGCGRMPRLHLGVAC